MHEPSDGIAEEVERQLQLALQQAIERFVLDLRRTHHHLVRRAAGRGDAESTETLCVQKNSKSR